VTPFGSSTATLVTSRCRACPTAIRTELLAIDDALAAHGLERDRRDDVLLVLAEILNNVAEHAFPDDRSGWIACKVGWTADGLVVETRDNGALLPPKLLLSNRALPRREMQRGDMPETGFGWFIVHALTDDMTYEREGGTNRLTFSMQASVAPEPHG
jgi:serine/threonine-protein kinase RsbW